MKKLFALLSIAFMAFMFMPTVYAENTQPSSQIVTNIDSISTAFDSRTPIYSTTELVLDKLEEYAKALKVPAEHVYKVLIQKQKIEAWTYLGIIILLFIFSIALYSTAQLDKVNANKKWRNANKDDRRLKENPNFEYWNLGEGWWIGGVVVSLTIFVVVIISSIITAPTIILGINNPEYGAINELLQILK